MLGGFLGQYVGQEFIKKQKNLQSDPHEKMPYFLVQCMYMSNNPQDYHDQYFALVKDIQKASPSSAIFFMQINDFIMSENYYKALKIAKQLINHEKELIDNATQQQTTTG